MNRRFAALVLAVAISQLLSVTAMAQPKGVDVIQPKVSEAIPVQERRMELSGCAAVEGGVLVVEDELIGAVLLLDHLQQAPLALSTVKLERKKKARAPYANAFKLFPFQDFEDIAGDGASDVYLIGSHHGKDGERRPDREFLFRCDWDNKERELKVVGEQYGLLDRIAPHLERLGCGIGLTATNVSSELNIEGLALHEETLYIGLRSPLTPAGKAIVLHGAVNGVMDGSDALNAIELDLDGGGVRALNWDPVTQALLVLSGAPGESSGGPASSSLYACDSAGGELRTVLRFDADIARKSPEGVCRLPERAGGSLLVVLDGEGSEHGAEFIKIDG